MKYSKVDWSVWPEPPSEEVYSDWIESRKSKRHPALTQTALNKYAKHVWKLVNEDVCSVEMAVECAAVAGWRALYYSFVVGAISREMDSFTMHKPQAEYKQLSAPDVVPQQYYLDHGQRGKV